MVETTFQTMTKRVCGLHNTRELSQWENNFVGELCAKTKDGTNALAVYRLSSKQEKIIRQLFDKFFSG